MPVHTDGRRRLLLALTCENESMDKVIAGRYELLERIGRGGMGSVWRARDQLLQRDVAVKMVETREDDDPTNVQRFQREAIAMAGIRHPNVAAVFDTGTDGDTAYMVMELLRDGDLHSRVKAGPMPIAEVRRIGAEVASALTAAHNAGIVHRDVKPGNVLFDGETPKVLDFGIAHLSTDTGERLTATATTLGTAAYISPEQAMAKPVSPASDAYSFGCMLYAMLTGHPPFTGDSQIAIARAHVSDQPPRISWERADVPQELDELIDQLLRKAPEERPALTQARDILLGVEQAPATWSSAATTVIPAVEPAVLSYPTAGQMPAAYPAGPSTPTLAPAPPRLPAQHNGGSGDDEPTRMWLWLLPLVIVLIGAIAAAAIFFKPAAKTAPPTSVPPAVPTQMAETTAPAPAETSSKESTEPTPTKESATPTPTPTAARTTKAPAPAPTEPEPTSQEPAPEVTPVPKPGDRAKTSANLIRVQTAILMVEDQTIRDMLQSKWDIVMTDYTNQQPLTSSIAGFEQALTDPRIIDRDRDKIQRALDKAKDGLG